MIPMRIRSFDPSARGCAAPNTLEAAPAAAALAVADFMNLRRERFCLFIARLLNQFAGLDWQKRCATFIIEV
jgi:hypothetical protein